jgi:hypothetical protein
MIHPSRSILCGKPLSNKDLSAVEIPQGRISDEPYSIILSGRRGEKKSLETSGRSRNHKS